MISERTAPALSSQQKFEAHVPLDEFMSRVNPVGVLKDAAKGATGIISTGDVQRMYESFPNSKLSVARVPDSELINLLRLVREGEEKRVFAEAEIRFEGVHVPSVLSVQTFVDIKRLSARPIANKFLAPLGLDLNQSGTFAITIENENGKYASILLPPIVTTYQKGYYEEPLSNLQKRVEGGDTITIRGLEGDVNLNLAALLTSFKAEMATQSPVMTVVLDGTHRAYMCYMANIPMNAVVIEGDAAPRNIPVRFEDVVATLERPTNSEDRYLGVVRTLPKLNLADLGVGQNR